MRITPLRGTLVTLCVTALATGALAATAPATAAPATASAQQAIPEPDDDPFYDPADGYESKAPGTVLKQREVTTFGLKATQLQLRSTDAKDRPITVITTLIVPPGSYPLGKRPLLSYQPATDSLGDQCNPSYTLRMNSEKEFGLFSMGLAKGWAVVVTDYQGPRNAYGPGRLEGHAVLDGIRAVKSLPALGVSESKVGLWGYSGGGLASGWAAELQPTYAPELKLAGVAAGGMPPDFRAAAEVMDGSLFSGLALGAIVGIMREYPELEVLLNDAGRQLQHEIGDMCAGDLASKYALKHIKDYTHSADPLNEPIAKQVLDQNTMGSDNPSAPVYLFHSFLDELIPYSTAQKINKQWCAQGTKVTFYTDYLSEHSSLAVTGAPSAVGYLSARFNGITVPSTC